MVHLLTKFQSRLTAPITVADTSLVLESLTGIPTAPFMGILAEDTDKQECVLVTVVTTVTKTLTITRAQRGTTAVAHAKGTLFYHSEIVNADLSADVADATVYDDLTIGVGASGLEVKDDGITTAKLLDEAVTQPKLDPAQDLVQAKEVTFEETAGAGVWTGSVSLPAGSTLIDIIVHAVALWDSETTATMIVGDIADPNGYFDAIDLKATDLLADESISFSHPAGKEGTDMDTPAATAHVRRRYLVGARVISGIITKVGDTGTAGRTRMTVLYMAPATETVATKA